MRHALLGATLAVVFGGCTLGPTSPPPATPKPSYTMAPPTPTLGPLATVGPTGHGRPYTAEQLAIALHENVPYNFPPQLQASWVARALADFIWTYDGRPYQRLWLSGSCGEPPIFCDLSVVGAPLFAASEETRDVYTFDVNMTSGTFTHAGVGALGGFPPDLVSAHELDALARSLDTEGRLADLSLRTFGWAVPPPDDGFILWYKKGDLEAARILIVTLDRANRRILSIEVMQEGLGG